MEFTVESLKKIVESLYKKTGCIASVAVQVLHVGGDTEIIYDLLTIGPEHSGKAEVLISFDSWESFVEYYESELKS
jgi:hypothetical protein